MQKVTLRIKQMVAAMMVLVCIPASAQFTASLEQYANTDYSTVSAQFKLSDIATALETDTATLVAALNTWGSDETGTVEDLFFLQDPAEAATLYNDYTQGSKGGFWIARNGLVSSWGAGAVYYNTIWWDNTDNADQFGFEFGQFPDSLKTGATFTPVYVLKFNGKQTTFTLTYNVLKLPDAPVAELEVAKLTIVGEAEATTEQYPRSGYESSPIYVNIADAAEKLGLAKSDLSLLLNQILYRVPVNEEFGIKGDSLISANDNGGWGRIVIDAETGDSLNEVCAAPWATTDAFYVDTYTYDAANDTLSCKIGQYPSNLKAGDNLYCYVFIVNESKAYRIKLNLNIIAAPFHGLDDMTCVGTTTYLVNQTPDNTYAFTSILANVDSIAGLLGCATSAMSFQAIDNNGSLSSSTTANNGGYWMTRGGIICGWGSSAAFFAEPATEGVYSDLHIGQYPDVLAVGDTCHTLLYLVSEGNYYTLDVTLAIIQKETTEQDFESVATRELTIQQLVDNTYAWSDAVTLPLAQIYELIGTNDPIFYALHIDSVAVATGEQYTKNWSCTPYPGFWVTTEGRRTGWGASSTWGVAMAVSSDVLSFSCIQFPDATHTGDVFTGQYFLVNEETGKMVTLNLTYQIVETLSKVEEVGTSYITLPVSMDDATVNFDIAPVVKALGLETTNALLAEGYYLKGLQSNGLYGSPVDAINTGVQFGLDGYAADGASIGVGFTADGKIWTYSNEDVAAEFKATAKMCFEVNEKRYTFVLTLMNADTYAANIANMTIDENFAGKIFNLQGQEIAHPTKGIYIINGKKFIQK